MQCLQHCMLASPSLGHYLLFFVNKNVCAGQSVLTMPPHAVKAGYAPGYKHFYRNQNTTEQYKD